MILPLKEKSYNNWDVNFLIVLDINILFDRLTALMKND